MGWGNIVEKQESLGQLIDVLEATRTVKESKMSQSTPPASEAAHPSSPVNEDSLPERPSAPIPPGSSSIYGQSPSPCAQRKLRNKRSSLNFDPAEFSFMTGGTRLSYDGATTTRPHTIVAESDWITEPDSVPDPALRSTCLLQAGQRQSLRPILPVRPHCLAPSITTGSDSRCSTYTPMAGTMLAKSLSGDATSNCDLNSSLAATVATGSVPPVPKIPDDSELRARLASVQANLHLVSPGMLHKRLYNQRELTTPNSLNHVQSNTIRMIKPDMGISSSLYPFERERHKLTHPSLVPDDLCIIKNEYLQQANTEQPGSKLRQQHNRSSSAMQSSPLLPPLMQHQAVSINADESLASGNVSSGTVVIRVPITKYEESSSAILPSSPPSAFLGNNLHLQRSRRPDPIDIPGTNGFLVPGMQAGRSPMMSPMDYASASLGLEPFSPVDRGGEEMGAQDRLKRVSSTGRNARVVDWLLSVRDKASRSLINRNSMHQYQQQPKLEGEFDSLLRCGKTLLTF
ncbi:hypothetical protein Cpir12675_004972 [Ceratocystis pirilliformis]|uniref:Uncharacterized protein n=1 Tax=Ceratocystis pirilliformis TaxID=259994 RepID=A0ABR3YU38_9PEZI